MIFINTDKTFLERYLKTFSILVIIIGGILGVQFTYAYFSISALGAILLLYSFKLKKDRSIRIEKEKLRINWGKEHEEKRDFLSIRKLYDFLEWKDPKVFVIDNITWRDLNMDEVFKKLDHTKSLPGMQYLYNLLRKPIFDEETLENRNDEINQFIDKKEVSVEIQYPLSLLEKKEFKQLFRYFEEGINVDTKYLIFYRICSILPILALLLLLVNKSFGLLLLILAILTNGIIYMKHKDRVFGEIDTFKYIGTLLKISKDIVSVDNEDVIAEGEELQKLLEDTNKIYKNVSSLNASSGSSGAEMQMIIDYINLITLRETVIFYKTVDLMNDYKEEILKIYKIVGKIDAYIALASYKESLVFYTKPQIIKDDGFFLETESLYHPLLDKPVPYTFKLDNKGALVTGSNASGKSTYLRAIGINNIFAQTFYTVLAKNYTSSYYKLLTSIGTTDNITHGDSYFMVEAKSLKRIIDSVEEELPVLCILDEIFRGTNTIERISAASEVLNYMIDRNTLVVAATHDIELTTLVNENFYNFHFEESIEEHDITFDYLLRNGPATSRNAIAILRYLGYPEMIYKNADKMAKKYEMKEE